MPALSTRSQKTKPHPTPTRSSEGSNFGTVKNCFARLGMAIGSEMTRDMLP